MKQGAFRDLPRWWSRRFKPSVGSAGLNWAVAGCLFPILRTGDAGPVFPCNRDVDRGRLEQAGARHMGVSGDVLYTIELAKGARGRV